ncbi:family 20 glycosylhydrolase [Hymenobacter sp. APR13]|uniref:glycoside hydrolase family 20 protein n=1 Tax=Hymenobacter sp. APR13 TaxID=1356852 RepID=UPI0012E0681B|nr:family 20 glycosylhydrolase [Hymenobacter sp. APR13]
MPARSFLLPVLWMALAALSGCSRRPQSAEVEAAVAATALLPRPQIVQYTGAGFTLSARTRLFLTAPSTDTTAAETSQQLAAWLQRRQIGGRLRFSADTTSTGVHLIIAPGAVPDSLRERYQLRVTPRGIWLRASTATGLFRATQTLRQLLPAALENPGPAAGPLPVPGVRIHDWPAFEWRGLLLDVSRHFVPPAQLRRYLDLLALHKLNRLHLHLTDDQGWRLESRTWPRLTSVGAWRRGTDGQPYGGFYRQTELRELVAYARQRHIELVPEVDMPGHVRAALAAYPELSCRGRPLAVATDWGVHEDVMCVGNPRTAAFAADVLGEVLDLFPGRLVHVGGDETPVARWQACPKCQALMRREQLQSERELQGYFLRQVAAVLARRGRRGIVWDEALALRPPAGTVVQAWHGLGPVAAAAQAGYPVVASPGSFTYFDQNTTLLELAKVYQFNPRPAGLAGAARSRVLGGEAAVWTERLLPAQLDQAIFPRLLALAEVLWRGPAPARAYPEFLDRTRQYYPRLTALGVQYGFETRPLAVTTEPAATGLRATLTAGGPGIGLRYTMDGTTPTPASAPYTAPLMVETPARLRVLALRDGQVLAELPAVQLQPHAALGAALTLAAPFHPTYSAGGAGALTDGRLGSLDYRDGAWQGFERTDLDVTLDLGSRQLLDTVRVAFLQDWNSWIFLPRTVQTSFSSDGQTYTSGPEATTPEPISAVGPLRRSYHAAGPGRAVRYVRIQARSVGVCPPGHPGAGGAAFLMVDEVVVGARR